MLLCLNCPENLVCNIDSPMDKLENASIEAFKPKAWISPQGSPVSHSCDYEIVNIEKIVNIESNCAVKIEFYKILIKCI